jgi:phosphoglucomutase
MAGGIPIPTDNLRSMVKFKYAMEEVFADGGWMAVRPSGTEPKIKFYYSVKGESMKAAEDKVEFLRSAVKELMA